MSISAPEKVAAEMAIERPLPGKWFARPRPVRWTVRKFPSWTVCVWMPFYLWSIVATAMHAAMPGWVVPSFVALTAVFLVVGAFRLVADCAALVEGGRDRAFSDLPAGIDEIPVEVVFVAQERYLGIDRGLLWFEGGLMHFNGQSTSFVLAPNDVHGPKKKRLFDTREETPKGLLRLKTERSTSIQVRPLFGFGMIKYGRALREFFRGEDVTQGSRQWPPMEPYVVEMKEVRDVRHA